MLAELTQHVVNGLILGGGYALMGIGLTLIFGIMRVVNFAHGEFFMLGAFFLFTLFSLWGVNFFVASLLAVLGVGLVGAVVERLVLRRLRLQPIEIPMLAMVALSVIIQNAAILLWDPSPKTIKHVFSPVPLTLGPIHVVSIRLFAGAMAVALIVGSHLFIQKTRLGRAMRATFQDTDMARLAGVDVDKIYMFTFAFGAALAGASGALLGAVFWVYPAMGDLAALKSFAVVIMGGLGDFLGAIVGGLLLGVAESLGAGMNLLLAAGQLNLGHTAFFGIGAYTSGLLALHYGLSPLFTLPVAAAFTGVVGYLLGRLTLKLRGAYFVLVTVGFAEVIRLVATNWMDLTQGPMGLAGVPPFNLGTERLTLVSKRDYYYLMAVMAGGTLYVTARLLGSRIGRALRAIQSNESLAESSGISAYAHTMLALVVSCVLAGAAGGFYAHYITFLSPELFGFQNTVTMAVMVVAGGQGMGLGPAPGSLVFTFLPGMLRMAVFYRMLLYGVIPLLVVMFMPRGLVFYLPALLGGRARQPGAPSAAGDAAGFTTGDDGARMAGPALAVRDVTVRFGGLAAVEGLSLDLTRGEILALIGPNGAGQSTAFHVIN